MQTSHGEKTNNIELNKSLQNPLSEVPSSQTNPYQNKVQKIITCPISLTYMRSPVTTSCGHTFDYQNIIQWIKGGNVICPTCRKKCFEKSQNLTINYAIRDIIEIFAPENTLLPPPLPEKFNVNIKFTDTDNKLTFYVKPETKITRMFDECRKRYGNQITFYLSGKIIIESQEKTIESIGMGVNSTLQAVTN